MTSDKKYYRTTIHLDPEIYDRFIRQGDDLSKFVREAMRFRVEQKDNLADMEVQKALLQELYDLMRKHQVFSHTKLPTEEWNAFNAKCKSLGIDSYRLMGLR